MDVSQYLEIFIDETKEHLESLNTQVLELEKDPNNSETINEIFRAAHSLKGMAGTMGYKRMQRLTHDMENAFSEVRSGKIAVSAELIDIVFQCLDALEEYLTCITETADEGTNDNEAIIARIDAVLKGKTEKPAEEAKPAEEVKEDAVSAENDYHSVELKDFEINAARQAIKKGMHFYGMTVRIEETCILKSARAFLVFKNVEPFGEVIRSEPGVQDIEDEKFDWEFSMFIVSKEPLNKILEAVRNVSEIKSAVGEELQVEDAATVQEEKKEEAVVVAEEKSTEVKEAAKQTAQKPQQAAQGTGGKPVVNRSVRVDLDKLDVLMNLVSELITAKNGIVSVSDSEKSGASQGIREQVEYLESITTNLHESVMKVRMMPIESVVSRFPRMIRDLRDRKSVV